MHVVLDAENPSILCVIDTRAGSIYKLNFAVGGQLRIARILAGVNVLQPWSFGIYAKYDQPCTCRRFSFYEAHMWCNSLKKCLLKIRQFQIMLRTAFEALAHSSQPGFTSIALDLVLLLGVMWLSTVLCAR